MTLRSELAATEISVLFFMDAKSSSSSRRSSWASWTDAPFSGGCLVFTKPRFFEACGTELHPASLLRLLWDCFEVFWKFHFCVWLKAEVWAIWYLPCPSFWTSNLTPAPHSCSCPSSYLFFVQSGVFWNNWVLKHLKPIVKRSAWEHCDFGLLVQH